MNTLQLPEIYLKLLPGDLIHSAPEEKLATCSHCYKADPKSPLPHYDLRYKCCTYFPFLPNYMIGAILTEGEKSQAKHVLLDMIKERKFALPIGLCPSPAYQQKFRNKHKDEYGNNPDLLCPFYIFAGGLCSIWNFRGNECATFYCVSSYGKTGEDYWQTLREILFEYEMQLSQAVMIQKGYTPKEISRNLEFIRISDNNSRADATLAAGEWQDLWVHHLDDIVSYYKSSYEFVSLLLGLSLNPINSESNNQSNIQLNSQLNELKHELNEKLNGKYKKLRELAKRTC